MRCDSVPGHHFLGNFTSYSSRQFVPLVFQNWIQGLVETRLRVDQLLPFTWSSKSISLSSSKAAKRANPSCAVLVSRTAMRVPLGGLTHGTSKGEENQVLASISWMMRSVFNGSLGCDRRLSRASLWFV